MAARGGIRPPVQRATWERDAEGVNRAGGGHPWKVKDKGGREERDGRKSSGRWGLGHSGSCRVLRWPGRPGSGSLRARPARAAVRTQRAGGGSGLPGATGAVGSRSAWARRAVPRSHGGAAGLQEGTQSPKPRMGQTPPPQPPPVPSARSGATLSRLSRWRPFNRFWREQARRGRPGGAGDALPPGSAVVCGVGTAVWTCVCLAAVGRTFRPSRCLVAAGHRSE